MWKDKKEAQDHYDDLLRVKEHIKNEANEYRMQRIDELIRIADIERKTKEESNPGIK